MTQIEQQAQQSKAAVTQQKAVIEQVIADNGLTADMEVSVLAIGYAVQVNQAPGSTLTSEQFETQLKALGLYNAQISS